MQPTRDIRTFYERLGGEAPLRQLVQNFYRQMDQLPECLTIRQMHAADLGSAEEKLFLFLSGWMGGPNLYIERYGHPRLRMRHLPFPIDESARDQWMLCMQRALDESVDEPALREDLMRALFEVADFMRNRE